MSLYGSSVEYGLHCLVYLVRPSASGDDVAMAAKDLADFQGVSPSLVAKIFTQLQKAGLVVSAEGVRGGYRLARPAAEITVLDVVDAVEGDKPLFTCKQIQGNCAVLEGEHAERAARGMCMIHSIMLEAEQAMRRSLRSYTLADLANGLTSSMPPRFMQNMEAWFRRRLTARGGSKAGDLPPGGLVTLSTDTSRKNRRTTKAAT